MEKKIREILKNALGYIFVLMVSVTYVTSAMYRATATGKTLWEIIVDGALTFLVGISLSRFFEMQGIINGEKDGDILATRRILGETIVHVSPFIDKLDEWCVIKNKENLKNQRVKILATQGLNYDSFYNENGEVVDFYKVKEKPKHRKLLKVWLKQLHCYDKALGVKLTPLTASVLTSEGGKPDDPFYLGKTKGEYEKVSTARDIIVRGSVAVVFGLFGCEAITDFTIVDFLWKGLQIALFLVLGYIHQQATYNYMTEEYRGRLLKKIDHLQMFENYIKEEKENGNHRGEEHLAEQPQFAEQLSV